MPTRDRYEFVMRAVTYFQRQDYPARELIVIDDGGQDLASHFADGSGLHYVHVPRHLSTGAKRNLACELAKGTIIAHWDDDDWYGASRLSSQVAPLIADVAEMSGFSDCIFFEIAKWRFWRCSSDIFERMFVGGVHGGTLVFKRALFDRGFRFPNRSIAEDALFLYRCHRAGARLHKISSQGRYIYLRHSCSTLQFECGEHIDPRGWRAMAEPLLPLEDREFYISHSESK
jgi:glycosyltransferase involved in cell wall biosynthesis